MYSGTDCTLWSVSTLYMEPLKRRPRLTESLLVTLQELMEMESLALAKVRELALSLTWNIAVRDIGLTASPYLPKSHMSEWPRVTPNPKKPKRQKT